MNWIPGIDVSRWQGDIDWRQVADAGYKFAMIRATVGDYYTDPRFYINWNDAREAGLFVSAYHVVVPKNSIYSQVNRLLDVLGDRQPDLPLVMDIERHDRVSRAQLTANIQGCLQRIEQHDGRRPVIYTAKWFWDNPDYIINYEEWAEYDLWVANYVEDPIKEHPALPRPWTDWKFWQYTDKGDVPGIKGNCDLNWFAGSLEDMLEYGKRQAVPKPAEPESLPVELAEEKPKPAIRARVLADNVNVRSGPGVQYLRVDKLKQGEVITLRDITGKEIWVEIEPDKWVAMIFNGERFLELE